MNATTMRPLLRLGSLAVLLGSAASLAPRQLPRRTRPLERSTRLQPSPTSALEALTLAQGPEQTRPTTIKKRARRKLFGRVFRRGRVPPLSAAVALPLIANSTTKTDASAFIQREYEAFTPSQVLGPAVEKTAALKTASSLTIPTTVTASSKGARNRGSSGLGKFAESTLTNLFDRWSKGSHKNLKVQCDPSGGVVDLVKGQFGVNAVVEFDRLTFPPIRFSKGKLTSQGMVLNYWKYVPFCKWIPRFTTAFDLEAHDVMMTQLDLFESPSIRHGLRRLLTRILHGRGMKASKVEITSITILPNGKVSCCGFARVFDSKVDFEVRSGLAVQSRGHVLTFPGLEISVSPAVGLFVPVVPPITLDMGHNAQITKLRLNGQKRRLELSCRATITPRHTRKQHKYSQSTNAFAASFHFDVGRWLTRIGNFSD